MHFLYRAVPFLNTVYQSQALMSKLENPNTQWDLK